jgi:predicted DsbA family dithiol-disulfide isomerase
MTESSATVRIDIVSDVVCPWCIIGFKQLQRALLGLGDEVEVELHWHPFELNPQMPPEGQDLREHIGQKYGTTPEQSQAARMRLTQIAESLGVEFRFYEGMRIYNTFRAHQLLHWAGEQGKQTELEMALFESYFSRQEDVGDEEILVAAAGRAGLSEEEARAVLSDGRYVDTVRDQQRFWLSKGIHAVPSFIFNQRYLIPGAQDPDVFAAALNKLLDEEAA